MTRLRIRSAASGLDVLADLLPAKAPENLAFLMAYLSAPRVVPGLHAMWTGPEISCPIPPDHLAGADYARALPPVTFAMQSLENLITYGKRMFAANASRHGRQVSGVKRDHNRVSGHFVDARSSRESFSDYYRFRFRCSTEDATVSPQGSMR